jgi:hypothetical protein
MAVNEDIMKVQEEILQRMNMMQKKSNKYSITKKETSARQVITSRSNRKMDEHGNEI